MLGLLNAAQHLNFPVVPIELTPRQYTKINAPMIALVDGNHFVVVWETKWFGLQVVIEDPADVKKIIMMSDFQKRWSGEALVFSEELKKKYDEHNMEAINEIHAGANIYFHETVAFVGTIDENAILEHAFTFTNTGTDTLRLYSRPTCSCMTAMSNSHVVPPGKTDQIIVRFDTSGRIGNIQQSVDVRTNDETQPLVQLTLAATIRGKIQLIPERIWLGDIACNEIRELTVRIFDNGNRGLTVASIQSPSLRNVTIGPAVSDTTLGGYIPVQLTFQAGPVPAAINEKVTFMLGSGEHLILPLEGNIIGPYRAYPPVAYFNSSNELIREIQLVPTGSSGDTVYSNELRIESASPLVSAEIINMKENAKTLRVTYKKQTSKALMDTLQLYMPETDVPLLVIPVFAN